MSEHLAGAEAVLWGVLSLSLCPGPAQALCPRTCCAATSSANHPANPESPALQCHTHLPPATAGIKGDDARCTPPLPHTPSHAHPTHARMACAFQDQGDRPPHPGLPAALLPPCCFDPPCYSHLRYRIKDEGARRILGYLLIFLASLSFRATLVNHLWKTGLRTHWYF